MTSRISEPLETLRSLVHHWQREIRRARETLTIGEALLPHLQEELRLAEGRQARAEPMPVQGEVPQHRLRGTATDQVEEALRLKPDQSSKDLEKYLALYGRKYTPGAISYALRKLQKRGRVELVRRHGNLAYFALTGDPRVSRTTGSSAIGHHEDEAK